MGCCILALCRGSGVVCHSRERGNPFLSDRYFFITVRLLKERGASAVAASCARRSRFGDHRSPLQRAKLVDPDFPSADGLALAFNRTRVMHPFYLTAWVFLPDPAAAGHAICAPVYPLTISLVMKSIPQGGTSSMILMNRRRAESGEKHKPRTPQARGPRYQLKSRRLGEASLRTKLPGKRM